MDRREGWSPPLLPRLMIQSDPFPILVLRSLMGSSRLQATCYPFPVPLRLFYEP